MSFEIPKTCSLIFVINLLLGTLLHKIWILIPKKILPCFGGKDTHSTNIHSRAFEGGHGLIYLLATKEELLGLKLEEEFLKDIFNKREEIFHQANSKCLQYNAYK